MRLMVNKAVFSWFLLFFIVFISSCSLERRTHVRNYPINKPFVYDNKVVLNGNIPKDEKNRLTLELDNYWDDSLKVRKLQKFGGISYVIKSPPVFDSANINRSVNFMNAYLNSQGFYYATFNDTVRIDTVKDQLRAKIQMNIDAGKNISIDSVSFDLADSNLQRLTDSASGSTFLKKGSPYTKQVIGSELDRLVGLYRQNGYFYFTREHIFAHVDSTDKRLLELTLDPFRQAQIIADAARRRKENPNWDIAIEKRPIFDSSVLRQYRVGNIYYYPETKLSDISDSLVNQPGFLEFRRRELVMRYKKGLFNYRPLREHTFMRRGQLYDENNYYKSINSLNRVGAWQQVDGFARTRDQDSLDIYFFLIPAVKQSFSVDLEGSRNTTSDYVGTGNLWGISTNFSYANKNVWKRAIQSIATFRTGVELNILKTNQDKLLQTFLITLGHTYVFPGLVQPFRNWRVLNRAENKRTLFNVTGSYVDRTDYYRLRSLVTSWGYEWKKGNNVWLYKPINIELYGIDKLYKLDTLLALNPFLKASFNEGKIVGQSISLVKNFTAKTNPDKTHYIRLGVEESGGLFGLFNAFKDEIYRYVKIEAEYRQSIKLLKTRELAYRAFAGVGYNYGTDPVIGQSLPFFKQFYAGGPYSMRAWGLRQLGMGSSIRSDTISTSNYRDRFGDMQLEANIEYRFPLTTLAGFKIGSAIFADIGNVWNIKQTTSDPEGQFAFKNLIRDLAIGVGTGLRLDFNYFLIRLDLAYKVKDPARQYNNGWMTGFYYKEKRINGLEVNNLALQLGIGLPF